MESSGTDPATIQLPAGGLQAFLADGGTVVTATRRLARRLAADYGAGRPGPAWPTPDVLPWSAWLNRSFRRLRDFGRLEDSRPLLGEEQSRLLWEAVVQADPRGRDLMLIPAAAAECRAAWELMQEWRLSRDDIASRAGEDARRFLDLADAYQARVSSAGFTDPASVAEVVADHAGALAETRVVLYGFERLPPAHTRILRALGERAAVARLPAGEGARVAAYPDARAELAAAAAWARQRLARDPAARLAIVVPDLAAHAPVVEDLLDEALAPARLLAGATSEHRPWNISLGRPLAEAPVVAAALDLLSAATGPLDVLAAGRLLRSPFVGGAAAEAGRRAAMDAWLRENGGADISAGRLAADARRLQGAQGAPDFGRRLSALLDELWKGARRRPLSAWSEAFARALAAVGWPGEASLGSAEYQATGAWAALLDELAALDAVSPPQSLSEACGRLRRMAAERLFQPESADVPVQVLGLFEVAGLEFDGTWVAGLHDGVLPAPLAPSAFIPAGLQRELGMPRADPDTEHRLAHLRLRQLAGSAPEVFFSWPRQSDDEPLRPSPLLKDLPAGQPGDTPPPRLPALQRESAALESVVDETAPAVSGQVRGGTGLLRAYSACPFQAFGRYRLACEPLGQPAPGVNPMARGQLLHEALQIFWEETGDHETLASLDAGDRRRRVQAAVDTVTARLADQGVLPEQPAIVDIEKIQAVARIQELLEVDLARPPFDVIAREERRVLQVGPLTLNGRIDRVDRVPGGTAVIDYKAGESGRSDWNGDRPREPQLPLYAVSLPDVVAVAFANLKPGRVAYQGLARDAEAMGMVRPAKKDQGAEEWQALLDGWRDTLGGLAAGVAAGDARVDPRQGQTTCDYCGLQVLCRRDELAADGVLGDD